MKTCTKCKEAKSIGEFCKNRKAKDGLTGWCTPCLRVTKKTYRNTVKGKAVRAWENAGWRCKNDPAYKGIELRVNKQDFLSWAVPEYEGFIASRPHKVPSLDRVDSSGHYEIGNLRIIDFDLNAARPGRQRKQLSADDIARRVLKLCKHNEIDLNDVIGLLNGTG